MLTHTLTHTQTSEKTQKSASRLFKVGIVFAACFLGEATIWLYSGVAPVSFFAAFETITSIFFTLDLISLLCMLAVSYRTLHEEVKEKGAQVGGLDARVTLRYVVLFVSVRANAHNLFHHCTGGVCETREAENGTNARADAAHRHRQTDLHLRPLSPYVAQR
jgi:hypothetical protein